MRATGGQIAFGPFCLDTENSRLLREGIELELRPQAFHALRVLVQGSGRCIDYEDMIREAWRGISVSRHTVAVTVGEVKKALREFGSWITYHPKLGYRLDVPQSEDLIRNGWHYWQRHTREGFDKALAAFGQVVQASNTDFRAWEGLARTYLMLGTFAMRCPREMYTAFLHALGRAVELGGMTPELRADRAQGLHIFELNFPEAEGELLLARVESPKSAGVLIRLAVLYATMKRFDEALAVLNCAYAADALWPILPSAEVMIRSARGEFELAVDCGKKAVDLHPYFPLGRLHYAQALEFAGRFDEALAEYRLACVMSPDLLRVRAEEGRCLARSGRAAEAAAVLAELEELSATEYVDGYFMAAFHDALGDRDRAIAELHRAGVQNSPAIFTMDIDPRMNNLRRDPRFKRIRNEFFRPHAVHAEAAAGPSVISQYTEKDSSPHHRLAS